jgi:arsenite-transporting ATPase
VLPENLVNYFNGRIILMKTIDVFEPAMCCNTGVCGPDPAQELVAFTAALEDLKGRGVDITRHNLANDPTIFAQTEPVRQFLEAAGSDGLPITLVNGAVVLTGRYPSRAELERYAGLEAGTPAPAGIASSGCGCGCPESATAESAECCDSDCGCGEPATEPVAVVAAASSGCGCGSDSGCC